MSGSPSIVPIPSSGSPPAPSPSASSGGSPAPIPSALRVILAPDRPELSVSLRQVPRPLPGRAVLFNDLGSSGRHIDVGRSKQDQIDNAYQKLRSLVAPYAQKLNFNLSKMTVWYLEDGLEHVKDLQELVESDPHILAAYEELEDLVRPAWGGSLKTQSFDKGSKSSMRSSRPLVRTNEALIGLPKDEFKDCSALALSLYQQKEPDSAKHERALKRMAAVETLIRPQIALVDAQLAAAVPADQPRLNKLKAKLQADRLALYVAAAFVPEHALPFNADQALAAAKRAAENARQVLQDHIDQERDRLMRKDMRDLAPSFLPEGFIRDLLNGKKREIPQNTVYSTDAAALVFSSLPIALARQGALDFWKKHNSFQKTECLEDGLLYCALGQDVDDATIGAFLTRQLGTFPVGDPLGTRMAAQLRTSLGNARTILTASFPAAATTDAAKIDHLKTMHGF